MSGQKEEHAGALAAGTPAPGFKLHSTPDQFVSLSDFRGAPVILAFYPADWSPVCGDQMALYNQILPEFRRLKAQLVGISVDGVWCHAAFAKDRNLIFRCSLISSRKVRWRRSTVSTGSGTASVSARCL